MQIRQLENDTYSVAMHQVPAALPAGMGSRSPSTARCPRVHGILRVLFSHQFARKQLKILKQCVGGGGWAWVVGVS